LAVRVIPTIFVPAMKQAIVESLIDSPTCIVFCARVLC
jgi:hypothetical protein